MKFREDGRGKCEHCGHYFAYMIIHNGFNESSFSYCDRCGRTSLLDLWKLPSSISIPHQGSIPPEAEQFLQQCECGGSFTSTAYPRCPKCHQPLSAGAAAEWIEAHASGATKGWRWQRSWQGLYCIVIENRVVCDNLQLPERTG